LMKLRREKNFWGRSKENCHDQHKVEKATQWTTVF